MRTRLPRLLVAIVAIAIFATSCNEGNPNVFVFAKQPYNEVTAGGNWEFLRDNTESMVVWEPYWDKRLTEYDDVMIYTNAYSIKADPEKDDRSVTNPEWVLRDANGDPVYIPFDCSNGCPQFAGDLGNPEYIADWIDDIHDAVARGYQGLYIDDVNLLWRFGDEFGDDAAPINPRTGNALLLSEWRQYTVEFLEEVRETFPDLEIWHNSIWYVQTPDFDNGWLRRQVQAADVIHMERGMNDRGITRGTGRFGMQTYMNFIDFVHEQDRQVALLDTDASSEAEQWFNLAGYFLANDGDDLISTEDWDAISPDSWWRGFDVDLGDALTPRIVDGNVIRRYFTGGQVVMNEPLADTVTVDLNGSWTDQWGDTVTSVTLGPRDAVVLTPA
ncbi:MAG: hypothetical protein ACI9C1_001341 [Candidatus Aldehydirespiratoraceae bacterium]|jgi:hypothetical protein